MLNQTDCLIFVFLQKLRTLAEERMRQGEENIQGQSFRTAVHYIDTALMVFKVLADKKIVESWRLGETFLLRAKASFSLAQERLCSKVYTCTVGLLYFINLQALVL